MHGDGSMDMVFVSDFDGYAGSAAVSNLLSKVVHPALASMVGYNPTQILARANGLRLS